MAANSLGLNILFPILKSDGTPFHDLVIHKATVESVVMSLGDKITGDVYYKDNALDVTMHEYIEYKGVKYVLVNPPTILREGMVSDNSELKGMTKYSFVFYHPMYQLSNIPFTDVAVTQSQEAYLSENRSFSWIGTPNDFIAKLNTNLNGTQWTVVKSSRFPSELENKLSEVISFDNAMISDALKTWYDTWGIPYVIDQVASTESSYAQGKRFKVVMGLPSNEIYESAEEQQLDNPFVFEMGKGVGLKNNSRTPRNNKIITRIAGYGSERNIPYGYPQIVWTGTEDDSRLQYPLYDGIVGGQAVKLIKHPFTRSHLMPSVYSERVNKKVNPNATGYNPNITLIDYYDATGATYPNNINPLAPSYDVHEFEDIYPELGSAAIVSATPLNPDLTPAEAWDDTMDDDGNYVQSYFSVALPQLAFDLYACAAITQSMELNMRSGACLGCTFPVQVDWDEYKKNFYHDDGTFDPVPHTQDGDGHVRDITKFPKSDSGSITIILQKETQTFGTLMPNVYQHPQSGDNFVILGISLPLSYITNAESRLDTAMTSYMLENNVYYYDYPLKFDEHFLATHTYILQQIRPNTVVNFKFAGDTLSLFVKQLTVKYGEKVLPQYDITLTDNVDVVLNQIGRVAEDVEKLSTLIAILRQNYGSSVWAEIAKKLSKTNDDTAQGFIRFMRGLQVGAQYVPDILGTGGVFRTGADGKTELVTDTLYVRMRAYFDSVVIREYRHESGNRIASPAQGFNCSRVEWIKVVNGEETVLEQTSANINNVDYFRCYWRVDDGEQKTDNQFIVGDLAFCENSTVSNNSLSTKRYWRVVVGRNNGNETTENGEAWIDVSNAHDANGNPVMTTISYAGQGGTTETLSVLSFESGSDVPSAHDDICMLGCVRDETRQGAIVEYTSGVDAPTYQIFQGIGEDATNPYVLLNKNMITVGYNTSTGRAMMNVYGDAYIGDPNGTTFLKYEQENSTTHAPKLTIKADVEFQNPLVPSQDTTLDAFAQAMIQSINGLQEQIDGEIDTWFYEGTPTLSNSPAVDWTTDTLKERHLGDLYYDIGTGATAGFAYRFIKSTVGGTTTYSWQYLEDTAITEALAMAAHAQDTADHKRRVFLQQPTPPYDAGDLWVNATYPSGNTVTDESQHKYYNDLLKCITSKSTGSFSINDWALASKYTDDAAFNAFFANTYTPFVTNIQGQVDEKAETWYQDTDPSTAWTTDALKESHVGDIWCDTSTNGGKKTYIWQNFGTSESPRYAWGEQAVPDEVFDKIDGKASIYVNNPNNPPTNYHANDLWILPVAATINNVDYKLGEILTATTDSATYNQAHWVKKVCYTDDTRLNNFISQILNGSGATGNDAVVANAIRAVNSALNENTTDISGGLVLTSLIGMRQGSTVWAGISGQYDSTPESQGGAKGHGIAAWYGGGMIDHEESPSTSGYAKSLFRFDGSGYLAGGNITWDDNGIVTIANVYANIGGTDTSLTGTLQTLTNLSNALPLTLQSGVTYIDPQYSFTANLSVLGNPVATQAWVGQNYVSIAFFNRLFQAYSNDDHTDAHKVAPNDVTTTITNLKLMVGSWTEQYLSALGINPNSGGGGGGTGTVTGIIFQGESTPYLPSYGIITLPAYPTTLPCYYNLYWKYAAKGTTFTASEADGTYDGNNSSRFFTIPEKTSQLTNDAGFITSSSLSGYLPLTGGTMSNTNVVTNLNADLLDGLNSDRFIRTYQITLRYNGWTKLGDFIARQMGSSLNIRFNTNAGYNLDSRQIKTYEILFRTGNNNPYGYAARVEAYRANMIFGTFRFYIKSNGNDNYELWVFSDQYTGNMFYTVGHGVDVAWTENVVKQSSAPSGLTEIGQNNVVFSDQNTASATKLETARTIWGQSFDGTGNIETNTVATMPYVLFRNYSDDGNAGYCGRGSSSTNNIYLTAYNQGNVYINSVINANGNGTVDINGSTLISGILTLKHSISTLSIVSYAENCGGFALYKSDDTTKAFTIAAVNGSGTWVANGISMLQNGNIGIDKAMPSYKLDVNGSVFASSFIKSGGTSGDLLVADGSTITYKEKFIEWIQGNVSSLDVAGYWAGMTTNTGVDANYRHVLSMSWTSNDYQNWVTQLCLPTNELRGLYYRSINGASISTASWIRVPDYDGNGASGTWGINISGSSASLSGYGYTSFKRIIPFSIHNQWTKIGTFTAAQNGAYLSVKFYTGVGYNSQANQTRVIEVHFRTGNGNPNSYAAYAEAYRFGEPCNVYILSLGSNKYELWLSNYNYSGTSFYVVSYNTNSISWTDNITAGNFPTGAALLTKYYFAYTDSNVASATKLQTARTIWGQSFDGTADVSGKLYLASNVYLEYDSANGGVHLVGAGLYADTYISALGANSSGGTTTFLTQDVADGRYLKLTGGTLSGNLTLDYQGSALLTTNLLRVTAIMAVNGAINTAYTLYVNGNGRFNRLVIGNRTTVGTVGSAVIETLQSDAIYIKTGTAPNYVDGTWSNTSDIRLKEIVSYAGTGLEQIANAPIFNYRWRGDQYGLVYLGTSAQHWQDVFEHGVSVAPNGYLSMDYGSIALASAVITARKVLNHEQRIINLERENERLRQEIQTLKAA